MRHHPLRFARFGWALAACLAMTVAMRPAGAAAETPPARSAAKPASTASIGDSVFARVRCDQLRKKVQELKAAGGDQFQPSALREATDALRKVEEKFRGLIGDAHV